MMTSVAASSTQQINSAHWPMNRHHSLKSAPTISEPRTPSVASTTMPKTCARRISAVATLTRLARPTLMQRKIGART